MTPFFGFYIIVWSFFFGFYEGYSQEHPTFGTIITNGLMALIWPITIARVLLFPSKDSDV